MKFTPKVKVQLFTCGTCRAKYNNPATHVCVIRLDKKAKGGAKKKGSTKKKRK